MKELIKLGRYRRRLILYWNSLSKASKLAWYRILRIDRRIDEAYSLHLHRIQAIEYLSFKYGILVSLLC